MFLSSRSHRRAFVWATLFLAAVAGRPLAADVCNPSSTRAGFGTTPSIACPVLPDVPYIAAPSNLPTQASTYEDWAWKSFIALNWPAVPMTNVPATNQRGIPDTTRSFATADNDTQGVWETWKEKRELFFAAILNNPTPMPADWNAPVDYPDNTRLQIPACPGELPRLNALGPNHRLFAQAGKGALSLSLDESLQVPSESVPPAQIQINVPVQPQVWHGVRTASSENSVVYEVKFNYDYYDYVVSNGLHIDTAKNIRRTNSGSQTAVTPIAGTPCVIGLSIQGHALQKRCAISLPPRNPPTYATVPPPAAVYNVATCEASPRQGGYPCRAGAVQTKAAWRRINPDERPDFH